jgi:hypothetical protein
VVHKIEFDFNQIKPTGFVIHHPFLEPPTVRTNGECLKNGDEWAKTDSEKYLFYCGCWVNESGVYTGEAHCGS